MFWLLFGRINQSDKKEEEYQEELRKYNEEFSQKLDESINKNQDWLYPIMIAISLWGIEKSITLFKDTTIEKYSIFITSLFLIAILLIVFNFYLDIKARTRLLFAEDKEKAYDDYICRFKFIGWLFNWSFWIFFTSILLTYVLYVFSKIQ